MSRKYTRKFNPIPVLDTRNGPRSERETITHLTVEVAYSKGGNIMGRHAARGWSLHVQPTTMYTTEDGVSMTRYSPRDGVRMFIHEAGRYSSGQADKAEAKAVCELRRIVEHIINTQPIEVSSALFNDLEEYVFGEEL